MQARKKKRPKAPDPLIPASDFSHLLIDAPAIVWRAQWNTLAEKLGLPFRRGTLQNLDSRGLGPKRVTHAGRIGYRREDLVEWLQKQAEGK